MRVVNRSLVVHSMGEFYSELLTEDIKDLVKQTGIAEGTATVISKHTTSAILVMEHEAGILLDIEDAIGQLFPRGTSFYHHTRGVDTNGKAHVLSALFGGSVVIPVQNSSVSLGEFQDIVFWDFQDAPKSRTVTISVVGREA